MSDMTEVDALQKARDLISDPKRWTQGWFARDQEGNKVEPFQKNAVCFCSLGALANVLGVPPYDAPMLSGYARLYPFARNFNVAEENDQGTHAEVLDMFDKAIAAAKAEA